MAESYELNAATCEALLRCGLTGRVALTAPTGPHIVPVNHSVVGRAIILRTSPYSVLGTYGRDATLAFEIDQMDYERHRGWSVVARGRADVVSSSDELEAIARSWQPQPWADGTRTLTLRLSWSEMTGRCIGRGWDPLTSVPVRRVV